MADGVAAILKRILATYDNDPKWRGADFARVKNISNTQVGDVGQDFVVALCEKYGFETELPTDNRGRTRRQNPWDIKINGVTFEVKTATEDVKGAFQFNHIRYHRPYDAILCIGISPNDILFDAWRKATVATGGAGHLVTMDKGSSATWKLTKRTDSLRHISDFESRIEDMTREFDGSTDRNSRKC